VAVFVTAAQPSAGQAAPDARAAAAAIAAGAVLAGLCSVIAARARSGRVAGFALGLAAGILYGLVGGVLKAAVHVVAHDPVTAVAGWPLWTLAVLGAWALILHQRAYTHAPLRVSLPALSVANPLAGMVFGVLVFGETPASGPLALLGEALGLGVIITSVAVLARPRASARSSPLPRRRPRRCGPIKLARSGSRSTDAAARQPE
jgi:drug/metabolite transporter (DMT)-like permease